MNHTRSVSYLSDVCLWLVNSPKCEEEEQTLDHIVFRCRKVRRVKDERGRGRREWASKNGMRWDSWDALASKVGKNGGKWSCRLWGGQADPRESRSEGDVLRGRAPSDLKSCI